MAMCENDLIDVLQKLAPLSLAESWDNVGLLLESENCGREIDTVFLCIDLNTVVFAEALASSADLIVAYHPPIFSGLKRLRMRSAKDAVLLGCIQNRINLYSPHTALDAAEDGVAEWLAKVFGTPTQMEAIAAKSAESPRLGAGRCLTLDTAISLDEAVERCKSSLGLEHVRVASRRTSQKKTIRRVAVCPGAGGSLFSKVSHADLFVTGEMRHHDVLDRVERGSSVILTEHTQCERPYLPILARKICEASSDRVKVVVSKIDADPLRII